MFVPHCVSRIFLAGVLLAGVSACRMAGPDFSAMLKSPLPTTQEALHQESQRLGAIYDRKPGERNVSLRYGQVLRQLGQHGQAAAVLQRAAMVNLNDPEVSAAYGKVLVETGQYKQASEVLALAHTPDRPNWRVLSSQGTAADQMGEHERAQELYVSALKIAPGEPTVLSNLGLSYALTKRLNEAERALGEAARHPRADDRVRANLAMVRALKAQGGTGQSGPSNAWAEIRKAEATRKAR